LISAQVRAQVDDRRGLLVLQRLLQLIEREDLDVLAAPAAVRDARRGPRRKARDFVPRTRRPSTRVEDPPSGRGARGLKPVLTVPSYLRRQSSPRNTSGALLGQYWVSTTSQAGITREEQSGAGPGVGPKVGAVGADEGSGTGSRVPWSGRRTPHAFSATTWADSVGDALRDASPSKLALAPPGAAGRS
jgi:hypothetical protein